MAVMPDFGIAQKKKPPAPGPVAGPYPLPFIPASHPGGDYGFGLTAPPGTMLGTDQAGNTQAGSWTMPDYAALLAQAMAPFNAQSQAESVADRASRNAAFQRAAIQFGEVPGLAQISQALGLSQADLGGVFGGNTAALAAGNTTAGMSTLARLQQTHDTATRQITDALAARGILHSGETGYQRGQEDLHYGQGQYDARNQLLDYLSGIQSGFTNAERQRQMALTQQQMAEAGLLQNQYQPTWTPSSPTSAGNQSPPQPPPPAGLGPAPTPWGWGTTSIANSLPPRPGGLGVF